MQEGYAQYMYHHGQYKQHLERARQHHVTDKEHQPRPYHNLNLKDVEAVKALGLEYQSHHERWEERQELMAELRQLPDGEDMSDDE